MGTIGTPIQWACSVIGGIAGWFFGDYVAKRLGYSSGWRYWAIRTGVLIGGAVIGWFAGTAITKIVVAYISKSPSIIIRIANKCGGSLFISIMYILGINPFDYVSNASQLTALARALNSSLFLIPKAWAQAFCNLANNMGRKLFFDIPHGMYGYHIHLGGQYGQKLDGLHFQVAKVVWNALKKLFGG